MKDTPLQYLTDQRAAGRTLRDKLPAIRRASQWYLYTHDGRKIFDMYLGNGRAVYGHKPHPLARDFKRLVDQGHLTALPSPHYRHMVRQARALYPDYPVVYLYPSLSAAIAAVTSAARAGSVPLVWHDPLFPAPAAPTGGAAGAGASPLTVGISRPLMGPAAAPPASHHLLLPLLPLPIDNAPQLLLQRTGDGGAPTSLVPDISRVLADHTALVSGAMLRAMLAALRTLAGAPSRVIVHANRSDYTSLPPGAGSPLPGLPTGAWECIGNYLISSLAAPQYTRLFDALLEKNILINPNRNAPTVLPFCAPRKDYLRFVQTTTQAL